MSTINYSQVNEIDLISYKSDEATKEKGVDYALPLLIAQHPQAATYEHWSFQKHQEAWRGWYMVGARAGIYENIKGTLVPINEVKE